MTSGVSIIIPCYNATATLSAAVASCFRQHLSDFEIVMVDDGSQDGTYALMQDLASRHKEISIFKHDVNKGGGAARNTAVEHAKNEIIFCLDSDDMLSEGTLDKMFSYIKEKQCDGVGLHQAIKFRGTNTEDHEVVNTYIREDELIPIDDLLEHQGPCSLYIVFMFRKSAFLKAGGYPTHHGFDTQGFAWRFLASRATAYSCPNTTYLHRVAFNHSYYLREASTGRINYNWFDILDEHFYMLSEKSRELLLSFKYEDVTENIFDLIRAQETSLNDPRDAAAYRVRLEERVSSDLSATDLYWLGSEYIRERRYDEAEQLLLRSLKSLPSGRTEEKLLTITLLRSGFDEEKVRSIVTAARKLHARNSVLGLAYRIRKRLRILVSTLMKKIH